MHIRLFRRPIISQPDRVVTYTKAAIALHNYLQTTESSVYCPPGFTDGEDGEGNVIEGAWRTDDEQSTRMGPVACTSSNRYMLLLVCIAHLFYPLPCCIQGIQGQQHPSVTATETTLPVPKVKCVAVHPCAATQ